MVVLLTPVTKIMGFAVADVQLGLVWEKRMEMNEKNNFRIFFHSLVWEF